MANLELRLRTFIPYDKVHFSNTSGGGGSTYYGGDNRSEQWEGSYRTSQRFVIDTSKKDYSVQSFRDTGVTKQLLYLNGKLIKTNEKKAPVTGITYTKRVVNDDLYLDCQLDSTIPFVPFAPAVNYDFTIKVTRAGSVRITGRHDGFPAYEFWRKLDGKSPQLVYLHDPRKTGHTVNALFPPMDITGVNQGLSFDA